MINRVVLVGHVGNDPEIRQFETSSVASFSLATSKKGYTTKDGKVIEDQTEWHNISVWGGLSGVVEKYVKKGDLLYLEGEIRTRKYEKDGQTRYATNIHVNELKMLGGKKEPVEPTNTEDGLPF